MEDETEYRYCEECGYWTSNGRDTNTTRCIGTIGNFYGALYTKSEDAKYYWSIENYDDHRWEQIPQRLFDELQRFQDYIQQKNK